MSGFAEIVFAQIGNYETCLVKCLLSPDIFCRSAVYFPKSRDCILNRVSRSTLPEAFKDALKGETVDYFENNCAMEPTNPEIASNEVFEAKFGSETKDVAKTTEGSEKTDGAETESTFSAFYAWSAWTPW